jgi:hypothetical protein
MPNITVMPGWTPTLLSIQHLPGDPPGNVNNGYPEKPGGYGICAVPQPGSFDATPPQANPIAVNQDPPVLGKGQPITQTGATGSTGNPTVDLTRQVSGQVPQGPVFRNPA